MTDHPDVQQLCDFPASELDNIPKWINDAANEWWNMILGKRKREQITSAGNGGRVSLTLYNLETRCRWLALFSSGGADLTPRRCARRGTDLTPT